VALQHDETIHRELQNPAVIPADWFLKNAGNKNTQLYRAPFHIQHALEKLEKITKGVLFFSKILHFKQALTVLFYCMINDYSLD
jgi:hypothetical protein